MGSTRLRNHFEIAIQIEGEEGFDGFIRLTREETQILAKLLALIWRRLGIKREEKVIICDYGTTFSSLVAANPFGGYVVKGAAEIIGCTAINVDGLPDLASRALYVCSSLRPAVVIGRRDLLEPFAWNLRSSHDGKKLTSWGIRKIAVLVSPGNLLTSGERQRYEKLLGVSISQVLKVDKTLLLASECCTNSFHIEDSLFCIETASRQSSSASSLDLSPDSEDFSIEHSSRKRGELAITNLFVKDTNMPSRYFAGLTGAIERCITLGGNHIVLDELSK